MNTIRALALSDIAQGCPASEQRPHLLRWSADLNQPLRMTLLGPWLALTQSVRLVANLHSKPGLPLKLALLATASSHLLSSAPAVDSDQITMSKVADGNVAEPTPHHTVARPQSGGGSRASPTAKPTGSRRSALAGMSFRSIRSAHELSPCASRKGLPSSRLA